MAGILSTGNVVYDMCDIEIIPFDELCTFVVIKEGFLISEEKKQQLMNMFNALVPP
jgi:hypothetical protein